MIKTLLDGVVATTTSTPVNIENLEDIGLQCFAASISSGNGAFSVDVSNDGVIWTAYAGLIDNVTNTNAQNLTRLSTKSVTANSSTGSIILRIENGSWKMLRVTVARTTDGAYSCTLSANKKVVA